MGNRVAIEVIDQGSVERGLPLEHRANHTPDAVDDGLVPPRRAGRLAGGNAPQCRVDGRQLLLVVGGWWRRQLRQGLDGAIKGCQRLVVSPMCFRTFGSQAVDQGRSRLGTHVGNLAAVAQECQGLHPIGRQK